jgi:hypothetical protein
MVRRPGSGRAVRRQQEAILAVARKQAHNNGIPEQTTWNCLNISGMDACTHDNAVGFSAYTPAFQAGEIKMRASELASNERQRR